MRHMKRILMQKIVVCLAGFVATSAAPAFAQFTLSGITLWETRDANGTWISDINYYYFNTLGSDAAGDTVANVYVFTGSIGAPVYRNSANTNTQLNPNLSLALGANVIYFACNTTRSGAAGSSSFGINLFFDGDITHNRISAMVPNDGGSSSFSVISGTTNTYGETAINGAPIAGSGSLSYSTGGYTATLSNFYVLAPGDSPNLVGFFALSPIEGSPDTVGSITLTVTAIPEPSTCAALAGLAALGFAVRRRRSQVARMRQLVRIRDSGDRNRELVGVGPVVNQSFG